MNEVETLRSQLEEINNKRVRLQTLIDQAKKQCEEIQQKYNVSSLQELEELVKKADEEYQASLKAAKQYIEESNNILATYNGI